MWYVFASDHLTLISKLLENCRKWSLNLFLKTIDVITQREKAIKDIIQFLKTVAWGLIILGFNPFENDSISEDH